MNNKLYTVGLAVNDERGNFTSKVCAVTINDGNDPAFLLELEGDELDIDYFSTSRRSGARPGFLLNHLRFVGSGYRAWAGNMAWDAFKLESHYVVKLCETLRAHKWSATSGETKLFNAYRNGWPIAHWLNASEGGNTDGNV